MNRRGFLGRMFGAGVVATAATLPKIPVPDKVEPEKCKRCDGFGKVPIDEDLYDPRNEATTTFYPSFEQWFDNVAINRVRVYPCPDCVLGRERARGEQAWLRGNECATCGYVQMIDNVNIPGFVRISENHFPNCALKFRPKWPEPWATYLIVNLGF